MEKSARGGRSSARKTPIDSAAAAVAAVAAASYQAASTSQEATAPAAACSFGTANKFKFFQPMQKCGDPLCRYDQLFHFHCEHTARCHFSTNYATAMDRHVLEFHDTVDILNDFDYFDQNYDCRLYSCPHNKVRSNYFGIFYGEWFRFDTLKTYYTKLLT